MRQKILGLLLSALALTLTGCGGLTADNLIDIADAVLGGEDAGITGGVDDPAVTVVSPSGESDSAPEELDEPSTSSGEGESYWDMDAETLDEDGTYNSAEDVSLYLHLYHHLPDNYITKSEAQALGWTGGSVERYAPGHAIGGDRFGNREGLLPDEAGRTYYECDIDTLGETSRGAKRIIFSNDGLIYYTEDHYVSFTLLYGEE